MTGRGGGEEGDLHRESAPAIEVLEVKVKGVRAVVEEDISWRERHGWMGDKKEDEEGVEEKERGADDRPWSRRWTWLFDA